MINNILILIGSFLAIVWGVAHLFPTKSIVKGFGNISLDNRRIILMEWIAEGLTLIFIGLLVMMVFYFGNKGSSSQLLVNVCSAIMLFVMAILSIFTGAKINFIPFRLCPILFSLSGILILLGTFL